MLDQKVGGKLLSRKGFLRSSRGMSYVEVLIALTVMSIIVLLVPAVMLRSTQSTNAIKEKTVAESLTRTQIEYLKSRAYQKVVTQHDTLLYANDTVPTPDASYVIEIDPVAVDPNPFDPPNDPNQPNQNYLKPLDLTLHEDAGIQEIAVKVKHIDRRILTTTFYKVNR